MVTAPPCDDFSISRPRVAYISPSKKRRIRDRRVAIRRSIKQSEELRSAIRGNVLHTIPGTADSEFRPTVEHTIHVKLEHLEEQIAMVNVLLQDLLWSSRSACSLNPEANEYEHIEVAQHDDNASDPAERVLRCLGAWEPLHGHTDITMCAQAADSKPTTEEVVGDHMEHAAASMPTAQTSQVPAGAVKGALLTAMKAQKNEKESDEQRTTKTTTLTTKAMNKAMKFMKAMKMKKMKGEAAKPEERSTDADDVSGMSRDNQLLLEASQGSMQ